MAEPCEVIIAAADMRLQIAHGRAARNDMAVRDLDLPRAHLEHLEKKGAGMAHAALSAARAAFRIAECAVSEMMPRLARGSLVFAGIGAPAVYTFR